MILHFFNCMSATDIIQYLLCTFVEEDSMETFQELYIYRSLIEIII